MKFALKFFVMILALLPCALDAAKPTRFQITKALRTLKTAWDPSQTALRAYGLYQQTQQRPSLKRALKSSIVNNLLYGSNQKGIQAHKVRLDQETSFLATKKIALEALKSTAPSESCKAIQTLFLDLQAQHGQLSEWSKLLGERLASLQGLKASRPTAAGQISPQDPNFFIEYFGDYTKVGHQIGYTSYFPHKETDIVPLRNLIGTRYETEAINNNASTASTIKTYKMHGGLAHKDAERIHCWVQWAFPTHQRSKYNPNAPISDGVVRKAFAENENLRTALEASFVFYLNFMGLTIRNDNGACWITPLSRDQYIAGMNNFTQNKHNFLRISRIFQSLNEHSCKNLAAAFNTFLTRDIPYYDKEYGTDFASSIDAETKEHWAKAWKHTL